MLGNSFRCMVVGMLVPVSGILTSCKDSDPEPVVEVSMAEPSATVVSIDSTKPDAQPLPDGPPLPNDPPLSSPASSTLQEQRNIFTISTIVDGSLVYLPAVVVKKEDERLYLATLLPIKPVQSRIFDGRDWRTLYSKFYDEETGLAFFSTTSTLLETAIVAGDGAGLRSGAELLIWSSEVDKNPEPSSSPPRPVPAQPFPPNPNQLKSEEFRKEFDELERRIRMGPPLTQNEMRRRQMLGHMLRRGSQAPTRTSSTPLVQPTGTAKFAKTTARLTSYGNKVAKWESALPVEEHRTVAITSANGELVGLGAWGNGESNTWDVVQLGEIFDQLEPELSDAQVEMVFPNSSSFHIKFSLSARLGIDRWSSFYQVTMPVSEAEHRPSVDGIIQLYGPEISSKELRSLSLDKESGRYLSGGYQKVIPGATKEYYTQLLAKTTQDAYEYFPPVQFSITEDAGIFQVTFKDHELFRLPDRNTGGAGEVVSAPQIVSPGGRIVDILPLDQGLRLLIQQAAKPALRILNVANGEWLPEPPITLHDDAVLTADRESLFAYDPANNRMQKWDLKTWQLVASGEIETLEPVLTMATSDFPGTPILVSTQESFWFIDPTTFRSRGKIANRSKEHTKISYEHSDSSDLQTISSAVSGNGGSFVVSKVTTSSKSGTHRVKHQSFFLSSNPTAKTQFSIRAVNDPVFPAYRGNQYFSGSNLIQEGKYAVRYEKSCSFVVSDPYRHLFLRIQKTPIAFPPKSPKVDCFHSLTEKEPFLTIESLPELGDFPAAFHIGELPLQKRVWLLSSQNRLITIPVEADRLMLRTFEAEKRLVDRQPEVIQILNGPPQVADRGSLVDFQLQVVGGSTGPPEFQLLAGPKGASLTENGAVHWEVPLAFVPEVATFDIAISSGGATQPYSFEMMIGGRPPLRITKYEPAREIDGKREFEVNPRQLGIAAKEISFDGHQINDAKLAGAGKYLVVTHSHRNELVVIDLKTASPLRSISLPAGQARFTANSESVFLYYPEHGLVEKRSLPDLNREKMVINTDPAQRIVGLCTGSHAPPSTRVMLIYSRGKNLELHLMNPQTLKISSFDDSLSEILNHLKPSFDPVSYIEFSSAPNGTAATSGQILLRMDGPNFHASRDWNLLDSRERAFLSVDGTQIYHETVIADLVTERNREITTDGEVSHLIPDSSGAYFLGFQQRLSTGKSTDQAIVRVYPNGRSEPVLVLTRLSEFDKLDRHTPIEHPGSIFYVSDLKRFVTIDPERRHVFIRNLDFPGALSALQ